MMETPRIEARFERLAKPTRQVELFEWGAALSPQG
jgi:hypothetical protein